MIAPAWGRWGLFCVGLFLVFYGLVLALNLTFDFQRIVMGIILVLAGFFIIIGK